MIGASIGSTHGGVGAMRWPLTKGTDAAAGAAIAGTAVEAVAGLALAGLFVCAGALAASATSAIIPTVRAMRKRVAAVASMRGRGDLRALLERARAGRSPDAGGEVVTVLPLRLLRQLRPTAARRAPTRSAPTDEEAAR